MSLSSLTQTLLLIVPYAQPRSIYQQARSDTGSSSWDETSGLIFDQAIYVPCQSQDFLVSAP